VNLVDPPDQAERTALQGVVGPNDWWMSRAAQLAALGGRVYAIKNDWHTPPPAGNECGDRLLAFDASAFDPSTFAGGEPWKDANWTAGWTPTADLGPLPFEVGHGASLVALPPRWCESIGAEGGLFLVAGCSPSNHEGQGQPSSHYALYDVESASFAVGTLPDVTGTGTSAAFHDGKVFVKRGGLNFASFNAQLWVVRPLSPAEAEEARAGPERQRMSLASIDCLSLQLDSNGHRPFDVWIDGVHFE